MAQYIFFIPYLWERYLPIYHSIYLSFYLSMSLSIYLSITISICQSINQYSIAADPGADIGLVFTGTHGAVVDARSFELNAERK